MAKTMSAKTVVAKNAEMEPERIEFESDGLHDSLTHALAPARFQELLANELRMAQREDRKVSVISLRLLHFTQSAVDILELKECAENIAPLLRGGDVIGRISEDGFWILIRGDMNSAHAAGERLSTVVDAARWRWLYCESQSEGEVGEVGADIRSFLRRMDSLHFAPLTNL